MYFNLCFQCQTKKARKGCIDMEILYNTPYNVPK